MRWAWRRWPSSVLGKTQLGALGFGLCTSVATMNILDGDAPAWRRLVSVASILALSALFVAAWRAQRFWRAEPFLSGPLAVGTTLGLSDSLVVIAICLGIAVALSFYGPTWSFAVRTLLLIPVSPVAVVFTSSLGRDLDWSSSSVLGEVPLPVVVGVLVRTLRSALLAQEAALAREQIIAATGRDLLGLTDVSAVRAVMRRATHELCATTPELVLAAAKLTGGRLTVAETYGLPPPLPVLDLPFELLRVADRSLTVTPVPPQHLTDIRTVLGAHRHWYVMGMALDDTAQRDQVMIVGLGDRTPDGVLMLLTTLGAQRSLAERACRAHGELHHQAHHDDLTGLPNRGLLFRELDRALAGEGVPVVLMLVDLDGFKGVNDTRGHAAGDAVLIEVGMRMRSVLSGIGLAARLGGDEFAVLLRDQSPEAATQIAERLWGRIGEPIPLPDDGEPVRIGASIGLAVAGAGAGGGELVGLADVAMYAAKSRGSGVMVADQSSSLLLSQRSDR